MSNSGRTPVDRECVGRADCGTYSAYTHGLGDYSESRGCRGPACADAGRVYRAAHEGKNWVCPEDDTCGSNSRYARGCRKDACGAARLIWQRNKRGTKDPRPSKYDELPAATPDHVNTFKAKFGRNEG